MSAFTDADRHTHAVVEVAGLLAGVATGSHGGIQADELRALRDWLAWRVEAGWRPSSGDFYTAQADAYDDAVRAMARAALTLFEHKCGEWVA